MEYQQEFRRPVTRGVSDKKSADALSVSAAMSLAKGALEGVIVRLIGEISEVNCKAGYKAAYFTIKDKNAALPCMMWNSRYEVSGVRLVAGQLMEITGRFTLYAAKGRMNFEVSSLTLAGEGILRQQVADLARKLEAEGLMNPARKRALPQLPATIGLVTSPRGDAVHDVLRTLKRRFPLARVLVSGVPVEGVGAAAGIIEGMRQVGSAGAEVVLVVRGGGSFEDLMPFNDEALARAISASPVPVVTGIGHEPDTSICDMVADVRASTPSTAAEAVSPTQEGLLESLDVLARSMQSSMQRRLERENSRVDRFAERPLFRDSALLFAAEAQTLDMAYERLTRALPANLERDCGRLSVMAERLRVSLPRSLERDASVLGNAKQRFMRAVPRATGQQSQQISALQNRLGVRGVSLVSRFEAEAGLVAARLHDLSPLAVLGRGYAIARSSDGVVVKKVDQIELGSVINVAISDGELSCRVEDARRIETSVEPWEESV